MTLPASKRWPKIRQWFLTTIAVTTALNFALFSMATAIMHSHRNKERRDNKQLAAQTRMWNEFAGRKPIPAHPDAVDQFARDLNNVLKPHDGQFTVPENIDAFVFPVNRYHGVTNTLGECVLDRSKDAKAWDGGCIDSGKLNEKFKAQLVDASSGNLAFYLKDNTKPITGPSHPYILQWAFFTWLIQLGLAWGVVALSYSDIYWDFDHGGNRLPENQLHFDPFDRDWKPKALLYTMTWPMGLVLYPRFAYKHVFGLRKQQKVAAQAEAQFLASHPQPTNLITARRILDDLRKLPHQDNFDVEQAVRSAERTVAALESIPTLIEIDETRIKAANYAKELAPVIEDAHAWKAGHKELMDSYHNPDIVQALRSLPPSPEHLTGEVVDNKKRR